ncbi:MAG: glycosyltransferase family 4 protein [Candidatus Bathyarchaeia archaeon]
MNKNLHICAITTWPPYRDGIALYSARLYEKIAELAHIEVMANKTEASVSNIYNDGIVVHRIWSRNNIFSLLRTFKQTLKCDAHLIHIHYGWLLYGYFSTLFIPFFLLAVRLTKRPIILTLHTVIQRDAKIYNNNILNVTANFVIFTLTKLLTKFSCKVIVHNELMKKVLEENYKCESEKVVIIPHGVVKADTSYYSKNVSNGNLTFLSLGFLREEKKLEQVIQGFYEFSKENADAELLLVGERHPHDTGNYAEKLMKLISELKLEDKVHLVNFVSDKTLDQLIYGCDLIILVSTKNYFIEASGALARMADFGKPIICSKVPKFQGELRDGYDCFMFPPGNVDALVKTIKILVNNRELKEKLASNLKRNFGKRYWADVAELHLKCYCSLLRTNLK